MNALNRCLVTNNPCGTDTWQVGYYCPCEPCQHYLRMEAAKERLGSTIVNEIANRVMERRARGRVEVEAMSLLLKCKRDGHVRNPVGTCVRCYNVAEELEHESA